MAIYMSTSTDPITLSGYSVAGELQVGANGLYGPFGYDVGDPASGFTGANVVWDRSLGDGFSTGWLPVELHVRAGGGDGAVTWYVDGTKYGEVACDTNTFSTIDQVVVRVGASGQNTTAQWSQLSVKFCSNGVPVDVEPTALLQASPSSTTGYLEQDATITPDVGDPSAVDEVIISGRVRLIDTDPNYLPLAEQMFVQAFVFAS
jgi:hypothetical protein